MKVGAAGTGLLTDVDVVTPQQKGAASLRPLLSGPAGNRTRERRGAILTLSS